VLFARDNVGCIIECDNEGLYVDSPDSDTVIQLKKLGGFKGEEKITLVAIGESLIQSRYEVLVKELHTEPAPMPLSTE
jgi:hypothetical protein